MGRIAISGCLALVVLGIISSGVLAATHYVAANGAGSACTFSAPCISVGQAVTMARAGDTVICLSAPAQGGAFIDKSITVDCTSGPFPVRDGGRLSGNDNVGIVINLPTSDLQQTVRLRGLALSGASSNTTRFYDVGLEIISAKAVFIEDSVFETSAKSAIIDRRTGGQTRMFVRNTVISNNLGPGIVAAAQGTSIAVLDNVSLVNNAYGVAAASGNHVVITRSTISGNTIAGVHADQGARMNVTNSVLSNNTTNVNAFGTIHLQENSVYFSNTAIAGGSAISAGGNRFIGNASNGSTLPLIPNAPADVFN